MRYALQSGVDVAGADRLITMHKVSFTQLLPASYENRIHAIDGVVEVTPQTWFGAWYRDERNQIPAFPVKPEAFLRMYPEYVIPEDQKQAWIADRTGMLIGRALADLYGWKVGDKVPLQVVDLAQGGRLRHLGRHRARDLRPAERRRYAQHRAAPGLLRGGQGAGARAWSAGTWSRSTTSIARRRSGGRSTCCSRTRRPRPRHRRSAQWRSRSSTRSATSARSSARS